MPLEMPAAREFGWTLKPIESAHFKIHKRGNGQFCVVLNHALLRGVRAEMIRWWFLNFANLSVTLTDTPGYENKLVPAYLLWHPIDHVNATFKGALAQDGTAQAGARIHIQEAMQYDKFGMKYPVNSELKIFYVGADGWAMGRVLPLLGPLMMLRIHFRDAFDGAQRLGVHYHYEVVIGASRDNAVSRWINRRLSAKFGPEFFEAWQRHNVIEVGVFENFLPALYEQRSSVFDLRYARNMNSAPVNDQDGYDRMLFDDRIAGFKSARDPYVYQSYDQSSFI